MKKLIIIFSLFGRILFSQVNITDSPLIEIFVLSESKNNLGGDLSFALSPIGQDWYVIPFSSPKQIIISNNANGGEVFAKLNASYDKYTGFNYSWADDNSFPEFGFGLYKLSVLDKFIYLDYRDYNYGSYSGAPGHNADIWIKYDFNEASLFIRNNDQCSTCSWGNPLSNGDYLKIWEIKNQGLPNTENVPNFWENCLVAIPENCSNCSDLFYGPHLVWGPKPNYIATGYKIYRSQNNKNNYQMIHNISNPAIFEYVDESLYSSADTSKYYYKVTA